MLDDMVHNAYALPLPVVHTLQRDMAEQLGADPESLEQKERAAREQLRAELARLGHRGPVELHVGQDSPSHAILAGVKHCRADLVVMGTVSRSGIPGLFVGNTAERLIDRLDRSLLAVKPAGFESPVRP